LAILIQGSSGNTQDVAANTLAARVNERPMNVGSFGSFIAASFSGTQAAGLAATSPIFSFRSATTGGPLILVRRVAFEMSVSTTGFAAGTALINMFVARTFTGSDTGGTALTMTTNNAKLRTAFGTSAVQDIRIASTTTLTAGTRTLDAAPMASAFVGVSTTATQILIPNRNLIGAQHGGEWPLVLAANEGFVLQATVPATGTWVFTCQVVWDEVPTTEI
jgi:hypothetical protein